MIDAGSCREMGGIRIIIKPWGPGGTRAIIVLPFLGIRVIIVLPFLGMNFQISSLKGLQHLENAGEQRRQGSFF
ncbi:hypothetical protein LOK49_LG11G02493 [Camellia lanceoleosa]|uniref:Uncharacterized protein n=1 Tax=Camellia lanceoleosa TaxID=1840588 RepID=A0ACC0G132_9ERIC|nr:hypothetical protein LOK49_LG11G02493 [Camellia lanceoleosa]